MTQLTNPLQDLFALFEMMPVLESEEGDYAKLVDEQDEQGPVQICRKDGTPVVIMPRQVWDDLLEKKT